VKRRDGNFKTVIAARLTANKDVSTAVDALALLPEEFTMEIFGDGRERAAIADEVARLALERRVRLRAPVSRERLWQAFGSADAVVFPTRDTEAFGLVGIEAQACGTPVVASSLEVFGEVFGASVLRFRVGDAADLAARLASLRCDPALHSVLSHAGRVNASRFAISQHVTAVERLCGELLGASYGGDGGC
jgi:glycosyltransferase involved in cell wall biosynthesis